MQIGILGPLEVRADSGELLPVSGARLRDLIAALALAGGRPVSTTALAAAVWPDDPPADAANALQTLVSRARRALGGPASVEQSAAGYRLAVAPQDIDANRFEALAAQGQAEQALALWRGPALADVGDFAAPDAARLHERRLATQLAHLESQLAAGRAAAHVAQLEALAAEHPLHERLAGLLVRALAATGRQADALAAYERLRERLAEELGVDPGPELQAVHLDVLRGNVSPEPVVPVVSPARRTNLRAQLTSFVGREDEVARIAKSLEQHRLVTLVGPGGAGKTRLASEVAAGLGAGAADMGAGSAGSAGGAAADGGTWLVELAPVTDPADIAQTVLGSLGLREAQILDRRLEQSPRDALGRLIDVLADKRTLLILDNCEHLIEACARLAVTLLEHCPDLRILTTSREPLGIVGEALQAVPPLDQPVPGTGAVDALDYPAVRLFADRAGAVRPDFELDEQTVPLVIDVVRRLDGLPLAIELAAARLRTMPLAEIAVRISDRFRLLTGGSRTALPRHRTLRAVVEWSWDLLAPQERLLAERLSVYPAGVTVESAAAVCADGAVEVPELPDLLGSLIDKSLLQPVGSSMRMRMLETIREYGVERLGNRDELTGVRRWHADHFAELLDRAQPHIISRDQLPWLALLSAERDNILAALRFRCDSGDADGALQVAVDAAAFAMLMGNDAEIKPWIEQALAVPGATDRQLLAVARALRALSSLAGQHAPGEPASAPELLHPLVVELAGYDFAQRPLGMLLRATLAFFAGDMDLTQSCVDESLDSPEPWVRAAMRMLRAALAENEGDVDGMRADVPLAVAEFRALGERWGLGSSLRSLGQVLTYDGDLEGAQSAYAEALQLIDELGSREDEVFLLVRCADVEIRRGDLVAARGFLDRARASAEQTGSALEAVMATAMLAQLERYTGRIELSRELAAQARSQLDLIPAGHPAHDHGRAILLALAARNAADDGADELAWTLYREAYATAQVTADMPVVATVGVVLARLLCGGAPRDAAEVLGAAARLRGTEDRGAPDVRELSESLTAVLGADGFRAAFERGLALDRAGAIACLDPDAAAAVLPAAQVRR